jgi:hypothetical protein
MDAWRIFRHPPPIARAAQLAERVPPDTLWQRVDLVRLPQHFQPTRPIVIPTSHVQSKWRRCGVRRQVHASRLLGAYHHLEVAHGLFLDAQRPLIDHLLHGKRASL